MSAVQLRERKQVNYADLLNPNDASIYGLNHANFKPYLDSKLPELNPAEGCMTTVTSQQFTLEWIRSHGLKRPVMITGTDGLGMKLPCPDFTVRDVATVLGRDWPIDVIDVAAQDELHGWSLGQWAEYYHADPTVRKSVLNVISLEFSGTPLAQYVRSPRVVRQLDWIDTVWPGHRRAAGEYPSVQYYCLMSVAGSWTDFHTDFGGTSVWYHVHTGEKLFLFAPPTEANLAAYEGWVGSPDQGSTFLPDLLGPARDDGPKDGQGYSGGSSAADSAPGGPIRGGAFAVSVPSGCTLLIPAGWIHAVYTPRDSLVFGGNFLHGLDMPSQLRIYELERSAKVARKYRFPYYEHMQWYAAGYYLQFTRLPQWRTLLTQAVGLVEAQADGGAGSSDNNTNGQALSSLLRQLHKLGLSLHEVTGLPSLLQTLAGLREGLLRREAQGAGSGSAVAASNGGGAAAGGAAAGPVKLKLKVTGAGAGAGAAAGPAKPPVRQPRIKGAIVVAGGAGAASSSSRALMTSNAAPLALLGEDEYSAFPASAAAAESCAIACAPGGPEDLLAELARGIDLGQDDEDGGQGQGSVLGVHSMQPVVSGSLYPPGTWTKTSPVPHPPELHDSEAAGLAAAAVGAACAFGLYGGALVSFAGEPGAESSGQAVVDARHRREVARSVDEDAASGLHSLLGGSKPKSRPLGPPEPKRRKKDHEYDSGAEDGEDDEDEDYAASSGDEESSSDEDDEDLVDEEEESSDGEGSLEDDGQEVIAVAGILEEKARDEALLKQMEEAAERRRLQRLANKAEAAALGNIKVGLKRSSAALKDGDKQGAVKVAVAASGAGQTRKLVAGASGSSGLGATAARPLGVAGVLPDAPPRPSTVKAVGYVPVTEGQAHGHDNGQAQAQQHEAGAGAGASGSSAGAGGGLALAHIGSTRPGTTTGPSQGQGQQLTGAQRLAAALKAKGKR